MIVEEMVEVYLNNGNSVKYYKKLGYICKFNDIIKVKSTDLANTSKIEINCICDFCGKKVLISKYKYHIKTKTNPKFACSKSCQRLKTSSFNIEKYKVDNPMKNKKVKQKQINTLITRYNITNSYQLKSVREKVLTNNIKYINKKYEGIKIESSTAGKIIFECDNCHKKMTVNKSLIYQRYKKNQILCPFCHVNKYKDLENKLFNFIKNLGFNAIQGSRSIIKPYELDIYIPEKKIAIELNGLYWHSEIFKDKNYHLNKTKLCEKNGIQLIHIFSDELNYNLDIVKSRLKSILGLNKIKIFARKTQIKEITGLESRNFLNSNHLQGFIQSKIKLGLYYNNKLVSLMTFGKLRKSLGGIPTEGSYEMLRFCNKQNITIVGGVSKLFKYFLKIYTPTRIVSYADRRWSIGNLYKTLGFNELVASKPGYWYIINRKREHRYNYRKSKLVKLGLNSLKSEHDLMLDQNIFRIYDCGNLKFEYINY
jgi:very-short-patch-repair endonuclease